MSLLENVGTPVLLATLGWCAFWTPTWIDRYRTRRRERWMDRIRNATTGVEVIRLARRLGMTHDQWDPYWKDAYDRELGRPPRNQSPPETPPVPQMPADLVPEYSARALNAVPAGFNFSDEYVAQIQRESARMPSPELPKAPEPHDPLFLKKLLTHLEQGDKSRARLWLTPTKAPKPGNGDLVEAQMVDAELFDTSPPEFPHQNSIIQQRSWFYRDQPLAATSTLTTSNTLASPTNIS